ncbi:MAG: hypothetical protein KC591_16425 [Gemmatimonadetes bacterium]|nr:hypothetical protein [Gemmatimonadota bacterium]
MCRLLADTFPKDKEGQALLLKVRRAMERLTRSKGVKDNFVKAPRRLNADEHNLKDEFANIWARCTLEFDPENPGASVRKGKIKIGPFFLAKRFKVMDLEKVILHEFLHESLAISWKEAHHGLIDQIIQYDLKYPGPPNVAEGKM